MATSGSRQGLHHLRESGLFPFVVGLFVAVQGLESLGIVGVSSR
jgi:hypothetical protein